MIGSFLTRGLVMVFGYAYPAYECFKSVEKNKPDIDQLRFWCQYWILVAVLTVCERIGDTFVSWVPMYSEAKLAFYIYLWYPKTQGTTYVYDSFFRPYISKHEPDIDRNLMELRTRIGDMFVLYWQRAAMYGQTRIFDILQYVASQSTPRPRPPQPPQTGRPRPPVPNRRGPPATPPETKEPVPPATTTATTTTSTSASSSDSTPRQLDGQQVQPTTSANDLKAQKSISSQSLDATAKPETSNEVEMIESEPSGSSNSNPSVKDIIMEEAFRVYTRARSRKSSASSASVQ
ncbi:putative HVA22-like protein g [Rutidosis leptorrhynchoides]|uniref:putative HVA22-like protein g n=1 Tax=Rutidosis leptorrhynchoides TaxID=125765 RepID=UPI003A9A14A5